MKNAKELKVRFKASRRVYYDKTLILTKDEYDELATGDMATVNSWVDSICGPHCEVDGDEFENVEVELTPVSDALLKALEARDEQ